MDNALIEFYQFIALMVIAPYMLGAAVAVVALPVVMAWEYLKPRRLSCSNFSSSSD